MTKWLALLLLAGCATAQWDKPGVTAELADADARACRSSAQAVSTLPKPQTTVTSSGAVIVTESNQPADSQRAIEEGQRMDDCMRKKGYTLKPG